MQRAAVITPKPLFCELALRIEAAGMIMENSFHLPLSRQDLANAADLSTVHVNRTLQEMR